MNNDTPPPATFFGLDEAIVKKIGAASDHMLIGLWLPLLKELMNGPKAIGSKASKASAKLNLERMRFAGLVDCDLYIPKQPRLWWITEWGFLVIAKYHHDSSDTEMQKTVSKLNTILKKLSFERPIPMNVFPLLYPIPRPRGVCPVCAQHVPLRVEGGVGLHRPRGVPRAGPPCAGVGQRYVANRWGRHCDACLECGAPDGPARLTDCGHDGCSYCGPRYPHTPSPT